MENELLYAITGRFVKIEKIGQVPKGERTNFHFMAEVEGPEVRGKLRGIDYSRAVDGVVHVDIYEVLTTIEGEKVFLKRSGLSETRDGDEILIRGEGRAETAAERLSWLNQTDIGWEAHLRPSSVEYTAKVYRR